MAILQDLTQAQMLAEIARLQAENSKLKDKGSTLKVSDKGAVSLYGLGRFPVTLYAGQWERLLGQAEQIKAYIEANRSRLAVKGE